ncbi:MAG: hypothetical protein CK430_01370 [Legionella sp.]|nr:MAG: hypothetical protein CK430_01370 [Legionella sp.]
MIIIFTSHSFPVLSFALNQNFFKSMKPLIKEATYIYTFPPKISIHWTNDTTQVYTWTTYPSQHSLSDFGLLFHNRTYPFIVSNNQLIPNQPIFSRKKQFIEDITYMNTAPPTIAIRWSCGLTDFYPWTSYPYPQNVDNFKPWFPQPCKTPEALEAMPTPEKNAPKASLFPQEIVGGSSLSLVNTSTKRDPAYPSQLSRLISASLAPQEMTSEDILDHNIRNYQPNPGIPVPHGLSRVQKLEIAADMICSYSNNRFLYFNKHKEGSIAEEKKLSPESLSFQT